MPPDAVSLDAAVQNGGRACRLRAGSGVSRLGRLLDVPMPGGPWYHEAHLEVILRATGDAQTELVNTMETGWAVSGRLRRAASHRS